MMRLAQPPNDTARAADSSAITDRSGTRPPALYSDAARGSALLPVTLLMFLFSAIAIAAAVVVRVEVRVAERFRQSGEALYAAEAGLDVAIGELRGMSTWTPVIDGQQSSQLSQGVFLGSKSIPGGGEVNVCCSAGSAFDRLTAASRTSVVPARRALEWRPFLWTTFHALAPREPPSRFYLIVSVAHGGEDAAGSAETNNTVLVRADAIDAGGHNRTIESLVARRVADGLGSGAEGEESAALPPVIAILTWREVR